MERLEAIVFGRVQGVAFRYHTQRKARELRVGGWCANQPDGSVRVVAEGARPQLEALLHWLHQGPPAARVTRVAATWHPSTAAFSAFNVRRL